MGEKGERTRREIVRKALDLFSVKGYFNTSLNDLLAATGVTKGCFYGHFESKEALWFAVYGEAARIWRELVLKGLQEVPDPVVRIKRFIENDMRDYLGADTFPGGCFFLNMAVELSGQEERMAAEVMRGIRWSADLIAEWLLEAEGKGLLRPGVDREETGRFVMTALNGAAALYAATHDPAVWRDTVSQLGVYIDGLKCPQGN